LLGVIRGMQCNIRLGVQDVELPMIADAKTARRDFQGCRRGSEDAEMPIRARGPVGSEAIPVWGHRAVVLAIPSAACRRAAGLRLEERQGEAKTQQRKQQTGGDPLHKQMDCTTSQMP